MKNLTFLTFMVILLSCNGNESTKTSGENTKTITVTIEPLRYFTEQIAGDRFDVVTMVKGDGNPESYEPSIRQMMQLSKSMLYIKVGDIGFERTWMDKIVETAPHARIVDSSEGIIMEETGGNTTDPHTWMSAANAKIIVLNICKALTEASPIDSLLFVTNLERMLCVIDSTDTEVRRILAEDKQPTFLIYHPALTYFARDYGLKQIAMEEEGRETSAKRLKKIIKEAESDGVKTFFVQREFSGHGVLNIAESIGADTVTINPLGYDWSSEMINIAKRLR